MINFDDAKAILKLYLDKVTDEVEAIDMSRRVWRSFDGVQEFREFIDIYKDWYRKNIGPCR